MNWSTDHRRDRAKTHKKDYQMLSLQMFSASSFTSRPRSLLFILVWESLNLLASSKTDSQDAESFPQHSLTIIMHISQNWMPGMKFMIKK